MKRILPIIIIIAIGTSTIIGFADEKTLNDGDTGKPSRLSESDYGTSVYSESITGGEIYFDKATGMVTYCRGNVTKVVIPEKIDDIKVKGIDDQVFKECTSLKSVELPDSIQNIGNEAFYGCTALKTITLSNSLKSIGDEAFYECISLISIEIPDSVMELGKCSFYNCISLKSATLSNNITVIDNSMFEYCSSLTGITVPDMVNSINYSAFRECSSLKQVELNKNLKVIDKSAFSKCTQLASIKIPKGVTSIGNSAFWGCSSLRYISLPNTITSIDSYAFQNCKKLRFIRIPQGVTTIDRLFDGCCSLKSIEIPSSVEHLELERPLNETKINYDLLTIYGERGSIAHSYATTNRIAFIVGNMPETERINDFEFIINENCSYNGKELTPLVIVNDGSYELEQGLDFIVKYENNVDIGTATAVIEGIGNYSGSIEKTFIIISIPPPFSWRHK